MLVCANLKMLLDAIDAEAVNRGPYPAPTPRPAELRRNKYSKATPKGTKSFGTPGVRGDPFVTSDISVPMPRGLLRTIAFQSSLTAIDISVWLHCIGFALTYRSVLAVSAAPFEEMFDSSYSDTIFRLNNLDAGWQDATHPGWQAIFDYSDIVAAIESTEGLEDYWNGFVRSDGSPLDRFEDSFIECESNHLLWSEIHYHSQNLYRIPKRVVFAPYGRSLSRVNSGLSRIKSATFVPRDDFLSPSARIPSSQLLGDVSTIVNGHFLFSINNVLKEYLENWEKYVYVSTFIISRLHTEQSVRLYLFLLGHCDENAGAGHSLTLNLTPEDFAVQFGIPYVSPGEIVRDCIRPFLRLYKSIVEGAREDTFAKELDIKFDTIKDSTSQGCPITNFCFVLTDRRPRRINTTTAVSVDYDKTRKRRIDNRIAGKRRRTQIRQVVNEAMTSIRDQQALYLAQFASTLEAISARAVQIKPTSSEESDTPTNQRSDEEIDADFDCRRYGNDEDVETIIEYTALEMEMFEFEASEGQPQEIDYDSGDQSIDEIPY